MKSEVKYLFITVILLCHLTVTNTFAKTSIEAPKITIKAMTSGEIQPKLLLDGQDRLHLLYFKIEDINTRMGHLYYKRYQDKSKTWAKPIQVSVKSYRQPDVIATAKLTVDGQGRVHVTWLGQKPTGHMYSRSDLNIEKFEPPRSLVSKYLEGAEASAVVSAHKNKVSVTWMAGWDEKLRTVYSMTSQDYGQTFTQETMIGDQSIGGCGCCAYASDYNNSGDLLIAYRSATNGNGRHMQLLGLSDKQTGTKLIDTWEYSSCPVSTNNIIHDSDDNSWATWETAGKIYTAQVNSLSIIPLMVSKAKKQKRQKHSVMAINKSGYQLIAWSEGDGYFSGGELQLQLYDSQAKSIESPVTKGMQLAQFSSAAVSSLADGSFMVLY